MKTRIISRWHPSGSTFYTAQRKIWFFWVEWFDCQGFGNKCAFESTNIKDVEDWLQRINDE